MAGFVPFNSKNLDLTFFVFRPMVVFVDELIDALKNFSVCSQNLGCVNSSILKSIHGNMTIWYGAWMKMPDEKKKLLHATLMSKLQNVSSIAILLDQSFFNAYAGESKDGFSAAKFSTGDTISMDTMLVKSEHSSNVSYACLALFKSCFVKMEGVTAGVCLKCNDKPKVECLYVWKSLYSCYSWLLNSDYRSTMQAYLEPFSPQIKYDIFRVVYVSREDIVNIEFFPPSLMLENGDGSNEDSQRNPDFEIEWN